MEVILRYLPRSSSRPSHTCTRKRIEAATHPSPSPSPSPASTILSSSPPLASYFCAPPTAEAGSQKTLASYLRQIDTQHLVRTLTVLLAAPDSELSDQRLRNAARFVLRYLLVDGRGEGEVGNAEMLEDVQILIACYGRAKKGKKKGKKEGTGMELVRMGWGWGWGIESTESFDLVRDVKSVMGPIQILQETAAQDSEFVVKGMHPYAGLFEKTRESTIEEMAGTGPVDDEKYAEAMISWFGAQSPLPQDYEEDVMEGAYRSFWPGRRPSVARYGSKTDLSEIFGAGRGDEEREGEGHWYFNSRSSSPETESSGEDGEISDMDEDEADTLYQLTILDLSRDNQKVEAELKYKQPTVEEEDENNDGDYPDMEDPTEFESDIHNDEEKEGVLSEDSNRPSGLKMCWDGYIKPSAVFGWEMEGDDF